MSSLVDNKCKHDLRQKIIGMPDAKQFLDQTFVCNNFIQNTFLDQTFECDIFYSKHISGQTLESEAKLWLKISLNT